MGAAVQVMLAPLLRPRRPASWMDTDRLQLGEEWRDGLIWCPGPAAGVVVDTDRLQVGEVWRDELAAAIARSRVALLLVSDHYLASPFINDYELPALIERVVLAPVLIGDCLLVSSNVSSEQEAQLREVFGENADV